MLHRPTPRLAFASTWFLCLFAVVNSAPADVYLETGYFPTSAVMSLSTPTIYPTSYVVPTAFSSTYLPTTYLPTSSVFASESVLVPTSTTIVRRSFFRPRRYIERTFSSYSPTTYVSPTSYLMPTSAYVSTSDLLPTSFYSGSYVLPRSYVVDSGVVTTSLSLPSYPCETASAPAPVKQTATRPSSVMPETGNTITSVPSSVSTTPDRRPQATLNSTPTTDEAPSSAVVPPPAAVPARPAEVASPPAPTFPEMDPNKIQVPPPGTSGATPPQGGETSFRSSRRPAFDTRNILRGRVISADSRRPEEGVTVIVSSATRNYTDRPAMTDADGEFKVSLPDGDWTVKVRMPSGSVYPVGRDYVTASNGRVTDASGRNVAEFLITR